MMLLAFFARAQTAAERRLFDRMPDKPRTKEKEAVIAIANTNTGGQPSEKPAESPVRGCGNRLRLHLADSFI